MSLNFLSLNPQAPHTLLLLHGAFSSHHEWDSVSRTATLSSYHLLIPDLPSHGKSTSRTIPFTLTDTSALLADLISREAQNGVADVIGLSLGGYTALYLASRYPDRVREMFVTGCGTAWPKPGGWYIWGCGFVMFASTWTYTHLPESIRAWLNNFCALELAHELVEDMRFSASDSYRLGQIVVEALAEDVNVDGRNWKDVSESVKARTCVVAGARADPVEATRERGKQLRRGNEASIAVKVEGKWHAWNMQDPELFSQGIKTWIEHEELPGDFIRLG